MSNREIDRRKLLKLAGGSVGAGLGTGSVSAVSGRRIEPRGAGRVGDGTLRVGLPGGALTFDPVNAGDVYSNLASTNLLYEQLFKVGPDGRTYPWLVTDWEQVAVRDRDPADYQAYGVDPEEADHVLERLPDGTVLDQHGAAEAVDDGTFGMHYEFTIREGVSFHDGSELTASEVANSYERFFHTFRSVQEIDPWYLQAEATDEYALSVYARYPDADFFRSVNVPVFPAAHVDEDPGAIDPRKGTVPVGSGVWQFEEFRDGEYYRVSRFDDHWFSSDAVDWDLPNRFPEQPPIEEVEIVMIPDDGERAEAVTDGRIGLTLDFAADQLDELDAADHLTLVTGPSSGYTFLGYPVTVRPWDEPDLRKAVNHLIPREHIAEEIHGGWVEPGWTWLPEPGREEGTLDYDALESDLKPRNRFDPEAARALLDGLDGVEFPVDVRLEVNVNNEERVETVRTIADRMNELRDGDGNRYFDTTVATYPWTEYVARLNGGYHERGHIAAVGVSGRIGAHSYAASTHHGDNIGGCCNFSGLDDQALNEAIDRARFDRAVVGDDEALDERRARYDEVWRELSDVQANSVINFGIEDAVYDACVEGFEPFPGKPRFLDYGLWAPETGQYTSIFRPPGVDRGAGQTPCRRRSDPRGEGDGRGGGRGTGSN